ncbi:MAG: hypothetical protein QM523_05845 [Candidatus Pacebacteria bacterium]|nr:hypothetical protein [Candidatus Paceibacterota bacterium]
MKEQRSIQTGNLGGGWQPIGPEVKLTPELLEYMRRMLPYESEKNQEVFAHPLQGYVTPAPDKNDG